MRRNLFCVFLAVMLLCVSAAFGGLGESAKETAAPGAGTETAAESAAETAEKKTGTETTAESAAETAERKTGTETAAESAAETAETGKTGTETAGTETAAATAAPAPALSLSQTEASVLRKKSVKLTPTLTGTSLKAKYTWTTSDKSVAAVSGGKVTGKKRGTATITCTAKLKDGTTLEAECKVTVTQPVTKIVPGSNRVKVTAGKTLKLTASVEPADADDRSLTWESSKPEIATVDEHGTLTALTEGKTVITAAAADGSGKKAKINVTVEPRGILGDWVAQTSANTVLHFAEDGTMKETMYSNLDGKTVVAETSFTYKTKGNKVTITSIAMTVYNEGKASTLRSKYTSTGTVKGDTFTWKTLNQTQTFIRGSRTEPAGDSRENSPQEDAEGSAANNADAAEAAEAAAAANDPEAAGAGADNGIAGTWSGSGLTLKLAEDGTGEMSLSNGNRYSLTWTLEGSSLTLRQQNNPAGQPIPGTLNGEVLTLRINNLNVTMRRK